mgnify:CR=1 FL=1
MKILFFGWDPSIVPVSRTVDYMGDCVYHGLKSLLGTDVHTRYDQFHMYTDIPEGYANNFHGKGFTLCGNLSPALRNTVDQPYMIDNLKQKVYDYVIFSRIYRSTRHYDEVCKYYDDNEIIIIDGHDVPDIEEDYRKHIYFKRELQEEITKTLLPISFSIPEEKLVPSDLTTIKEKELGQVVPGQQDTYTFTSEKEYYKDYEKSLYGITHKKGGWDCMRHLEIMANKCVPFFPGNEECPPHTMVDYPKSLIFEATQRVQNKTMTQELYEEYCDKMYNHVRENQTTVAQAKELIKIIKRTREKWQTQ